MLTHDKSPSAMNARAPRVNQSNRTTTTGKCTIYRLIDAMLRPVWDLFSQADVQAIFKILTRYFSESRLYQHTVASFLRYHSAHDPHLNQVEHKALEGELQSARQAQADAEFSRELASGMIAKISKAVRYAPVQKLQILDAYIAKSIELSGVPEDE